MLNNLYSGGIVSHESKKQTKQTESDLARSHRKRNLFLHSDVELPNNNVIRSHVSCAKCQVYKNQRDISPRDGADNYFHV